MEKMTKESTTLQRAAKKQAKAYNNEAKSLRSAFLACVRADRVPELLKFYEKAGVPAADCSANEATAWRGYEDIKQLLPYYTDANGKWKPIATTTCEKDRLTLDETRGAETFKNLPGVRREVLNACAIGKGALKEAQYYIEKQVQTHDEERTESADGSITIVRKNFRTETRRMYICESDGKVKQGDINRLFLEILGVPAAIASAKMDELEQAQARAILKAEREKERLEKMQANAQLSADNLNAKAAAKAAKAEQLQAEAKQTREKAAEIYAKAAAKDGAKQASNAVTMERTKQRAKTNTQTKASKQVNKF